MRKEGYYWVKVERGSCAEWQVKRWINNDWYMLPAYDIITEIDEYPIFRRTRYNLKYQCQTATDTSETRNPYDVMRSLGYHVVHSEHHPIGDCYFFVVEEIKLPLPNYLTIL